MPSPAFRINGGAVGAKASVSAGGAVTATLDSTDGVRSVSWSVIGTDETTEAADYTLVQSGSVGQTVTFTAGSAGTAGILRAEINGGVNLQTEQADATTRATSKWYVPTSGGSEVGCVNETYESDSTYGWVGIVNDAVRSAGGGGSVTDVTASSPLSSTGGTTPQISISTTPSFTSVTATSHYQVGAGTKRFQDGAPSAAGHVSTDANGRLTVYQGASLRTVPHGFDVPVEFKWEKPAADSGGTDTTSERAFGGDTLTGLVGVTVQIIPGANLTANNTNYAQISVYKRADSSGRTLYAQCTTRIAGADATGNWVAFDFVNVPLVTPNDPIEPGVYVTVEITKPGGTGVILPQFTLLLSGTRDIEA